MASEELQISAVQAPKPLYFCPLCAKPFIQESSCTRHVKYCRRRASQQRKGRPKACIPCRAAKSKCDFKSICSRCADKQVACSYDKDHGAVSVTSRTKRVFVPDEDFFSSQVDTAADQGAHTTAHPGRECVSIPGNSEYLVRSSLDNLADISVFDLFNSKSTETGHGDQNLSSRKDFSLPHIFADVLEGPTNPRNGGSDTRHSESSFNSLAAQNVFKIASTPSVIVARPSLIANYISNGCRQFLLSIVHSYPRMIGQHNNLPPFIHPYGCGLHFDGRVSDVGSIYDGTLNQITPLKPLEVCMNVARMLVSQPSSSGLNDFIWRITESENKHIIEKMEHFSIGELIAALQSTMIYGIMRVTISGRSYSETNPHIVRAMEELGIRICTLVAGPFSPRHARATRPTWEEWICQETRRRISVMCFLHALVIGTDPCNPITNPNNHQLPSSKALWDARNRWEWEREYDSATKDQSIRDTNNSIQLPPQFETVGDLVIAKLGGMGTNNAAAAVNDIIGKWYAEMDGLGMMLAAVVASI